MNKDAQGRWKVGMSNTKLKMRANIVLRSVGGNRFKGWEVRAGRGAGRTGDIPTNGGYLARTLASRVSFRSASDPAESPRGVLSCEAGVRPYHEGYRVAGAEACSPVARRLL